MELPPEVLSDIFRDLPNADLKNIRLVSKSFLRVTTPMLFGTIRLAANTRALQISKLVCQHFASCVETIVVLPVGYRASANSARKEWYNRKVLTDCSEQGLQCPSREAIDKGYHMYRRLRSEASEILGDDEIYLLLCHFLNLAPRIRRIVLANFDYKDGVHASGQSAFTDYNRAVVGDGMCGTDGVLMDGPVRNFQKILLTIATAQCTIKELIFDQEVALDPNAFQLSVRQQSHALHVLPALTKLQLSLGIGHISGNTRKGFLEAGICRFLVHATNLKALAISMGQDTLDSSLDTNPTSFQAVFDGCAYPSLRTLILSSFDTGAQEFLTFLERSKDLKHLAIEDCRLTTDSWEDFADAIRASLTLKSICINDLKGGFEAPLISWYDRDDQMNGFFFNNAPNPLSHVELEEWYSRCEIDDRDPMDAHKIAFDEHVRRLF